jgi:hypothetical protein
VITRAERHRARRRYPRLFLLGFALWAALALALAFEAQASGKIPARLSFREVTPEPPPPVSFRHQPHPIRYAQAAAGLDVVATCIALNQGGFRERNPLFGSDPKCSSVAVPILLQALTLEWLRRRDARRCRLVPGGKRLRKCRRAKLVGWVTTTAHGAASAWNINQVLGSR